MKNYKESMLLGERNGTLALLAVSFVAPKTPSGQSQTDESFCVSNRCQTLCNERQRLRVQSFVYWCPAGGIERVSPPGLASQTLTLSVSQ